MSGAEHHVLVVTEGPNGEDIDADVNWTLDGQCSPNCAVYYQCSIEGCKPTKAEREAAEYERHGAHHQPIEGRWMVESQGECGLMTSGSGAESLSDIATSRGPGIWAVETDYEGDGEWYALAGQRVDQ